MSFGVLISIHVLELGNKLLHFFGKLVKFGSKMNSEIYNKKEEIVSMFLGLGIVVLFTFLMANYFRKHLAGKVDLPGITDKVLVSPTNKLITKNTINTKEKEEAFSDLTEDYIVKSGDSLSKIAKRFYGKADKWLVIAKDNNIKNANSILVGQKLKLVKTSSDKIDSSILGKEYKIQQGDTLVKVALRAYGDSYAWVKIWKANKNIVNPNMIHVGNVLVIPRG